MLTSIDGGFDEACTNNVDEYYFDKTNDQSWACTFGTGEEVCMCVSANLSLYSQV